MRIGYFSFSLTEAGGIDYHGWTMKQQKHKKTGKSPAAKRGKPTTIELPVEIWRDLKVLALMKETTLRNIIVEAAREYLVEHYPVERS